MSPNVFGSAAASEAQLARFVKLMTSSQSFNQGSVTHEQQIDLPSILQRALHNAELWELHRLRGEHAAA